MSNTKTFPRVYNFIRYHASFIIFSLLIVVFLCGYGLKSGDYEAFLSINYLDPGSLIDRWNNWTSRTLVDWSMSFAAHNLILFLIITFLLLWLLFQSINKILLYTTDTKDGALLRSMIGVSFLILFNIGLFTSAGVVATTVGFLWTLSLLVYGSTLIIGKNGIFSIVLKSLALVYATCMEQIAIVVLIGAIFYAIHSVMNKKNISKLIIFPVFIALVQLFNAAVLSPGNKIRLAKEVTSWFPQFNDMSMIRKIDIGFIDTMQHFFVNPFWIILALLAVLIYIAFKRRAHLALIIASAQFLLLVTYNSAQNYIVTGVNNIIAGWNIKDFNLLLSTNGLTGTGHGLYSILPDVYFIVMTLSLLYVIWKICDTFAERYWIFSILFIGFCSRMVMALSPTIYASADRTFVVMVFCVYIVFLYLIAKHLGSIMPSKK